MRFSTKAITTCAVLAALALALSYLESFFPPLLPLPGVKLGLANIVVIFALYRLGPGPAAVISFVRVLLMTFMFGNAFALFYSLSGAVLSLTVMLLLKKTGKFSPVGVGAAGGVTHNIGQILCAMVVLETEKLAYYLPVLLVSGTLAGIGIGIVGGILIKRIDPERV